MQRGAGENRDIGKLAFLSDHGDADIVEAGCEQIFLDRIDLVAGERHVIELRRIGGEEAPRYLVRDANELKRYGINTVAISSNDVDDYPEDSFDNMKRFAKEHGFTFPYLYDESQGVARAYDAVCTPDFFGFNGKLELQYRGRLDASRKEAGPADARRELFEAMREVAETGRGPREQTASMGCSIKWKAA